MSTPEARQGPPNHDPTKVLLGATESSDRIVTNHDTDPADAPVARAVGMDSDGKLITDMSGGEKPVGVSMGRTLSDSKRTAVCRAGNRVPLELAAYLAEADLTLIKKVTAPVSVEFVGGETAGSETVQVTGDAESGYLISVGIEDGVSTATEVKAALDGEAAALALVETVITGTAGDPQDAFAEQPIATLEQAVIGAAVEISDETGMAIPSVSAASAIVTGATYVSGMKTGVSPWGAAGDKPVALVDMGGGL